MKYFKYKVILISCIIFTAFSVKASSDTTNLIGPKPAIGPGKVLLLSAIIPGAGQFLNRRYFKAGTFFALEAITVSATAGWNLIAQSRADEYHSIIASAALDTGLLRAKKLESAHEQKFQSIEAEFKRYNALTWAGGVYLYNLFDAFDLTGFFKDNGKRNPSMAFGLAAIPGLGLGQIYNGSYSKAGLFMMIQASLGVLAYNNHRLMRLAESNYRRISDTTITLPSIKTSVSSDWEGKRRTAMKNRNSYLWYSIFTYVIGMLDAVVDAHLHDYQERMRIEPDLVPSENGTGLNLKLNF